MRNNYCNKCNFNMMAYQSDPGYSTSNYTVIKKSPITCKKILEVYQCNGQYVKYFNTGYNISNR